MTSPPPAAEIALREESPPPIRVEQTMDDFIGMALRNASIDVNKLEALLRMKREAVAEQAKVAFYEALHAAQAEMPQVERLGVVRLISKDGKDLGSYNFAKWEDMDRVLRPIMERHGFTLDFDMEQRAAEGGGAKVTATLTHAKDGRTHSMTRAVSLALDGGAGRNNLQAMGSTLSYAKRYLAEMLFNIVRKGADDDGVSASKKYITPEQADELRALSKQAKRDEGALLDRLFNGTARSFDEIEAGAFVVVKNMLDGIIKQSAKKPPPEGTV
jgi:hypothetical protein